MAKRISKQSKVEPPAVSLREALNLLDPGRTIRGSSELERYYVARGHTPLDELIPLLANAQEPQKILFSGHRGSGKTTELAQLAARLQSTHFPIHYSVRSVLNLFDLTYVDVLLSMGLELIDALSEKNIEISPELLKQLLDFGRDITREVEISVSGKPEVGAELNFLIGKLSAKLATEDATRKLVRERVSHKLSELLDNIGLLAAEIERVTNKKPLLIVEDLDKTDLKVARDLFYGHASSLLAPRVSVIYTFPIALRHSNDFMQIEMYFPNSYILPNLKTHSHDNKPFERDLQKLEEILTRRVGQNVFEANALRKLAQASGGIPLELISLGRQAILSAIRNSKSRVDTADVNDAIKRKRMDYQVLLTSRQYELIREVSRTKKLENHEDNRALLHNLSALEYRNDIVWYDVHPAVEGLLKERG